MNLTLTRKVPSSDQYLNRAIILGIDPGLRATGFGIISQHQDQLRYITSGVIRADADLSLGARLNEIFSGLTEIIGKYVPTEASIEKVFVNVNPNSTLLLGQARGAALCAIAAQNLEAREYTALQIKQAVVGQGHADKKQVQDMVKRMLLLEACPASDAADALACAICHAFHRAAPISSIKKGYRFRRGRLL